MTRCALLLTGRIDFWEECFSAIKKHVIDVHHPVVFASVHGEETDQQVRDFANAYGITPDHLRISKMQLKLPNHDVWSRGPPNMPMGTMRYGSMFYHIQQVSEMVDDSFDYVIRFRADNAPQSDYPIPPTPIPPDTILIPNAYAVYGHCPSDWIPDQHGMFTVSVLRKYADIFSTIEKYYDDYGIDLIIPERTLFNHMQRRGVIWSELPSPYTYTGLHHRRHKDEFRD